MATIAAKAPRNFAQGPVWKNILAQALPLKAAEQKDKRHLYFCRCLFSWRR